MTRTHTYTEAEKALVSYLKEKLAARGIQKFPRDWHLKQLSTARNMLAGDKAPSPEEWRRCIDWAFADPFWCDKVDHLARIEALWPKYMLQQGGAGRGRAAQAKRNPPKRGSWGASRKGKRYIGQNDPLPF